MVWVKLETLNNWQHPNYHQFDSDGANYELYCLLGVDPTAPISGKLIYFEGYTTRSIESLKEFSI